MGKFDRTDAMQRITRALQFLRDAGEDGQRRLRTVLEISGFGTTCSYTTPEMMQVVIEAVMGLHTDRDLADILAESEYQAMKLRRAA